MGLRETKESVQQLLNIFSALKDGETILAGLEQAEQNAAELTTIKANLDKEMEFLNEKRSDLVDEIAILQKQVDEAPTTAKQIVADAEKVAENIIDKANDDAETAAAGIIAAAKAEADEVKKKTAAANEKLDALTEECQAESKELETIRAHLADAREQVKKLLGG